MALGLLEQLDAHDGRPDVAVTVDLVKVAQNADAVAPLALMYEAHASVSGFVQASTAGTRAKRYDEAYIFAVLDRFRTKTIAALGCSWHSCKASIRCCLYSLSLCRRIFGSLSLSFESGQQDSGRVISHESRHVCCLLSCSGGASTVLSP